MDGSLMVGKGDKLSFEDMRPEERAIVKALEAAHRSGQNVLRIAEIMSANDWDLVEEHDCSESRNCSVCSTALRLGNSKVRNNLRRLMRYGVITRPADGTYALVRETKPEPKLVQIRPNPRKLNEDEAKILRHAAEGINVKMVEAVKHTDCSFYNACLDQALFGKWEGFSCAACTAYSVPDQLQRESDMLSLRALQTASDMLDEHGKVNRVRGVKPGADAKRTILEDEDLADVA